VGAAVGHGTDPEALLRAADAAMYRVKHDGKGAYAVV
jgi:GGDEF domain-containing protein